jgi:protein TonB
MTGSSKTHSTGLSLVRSGSQPHIGASVPERDAFGEGRILPAWSPTRAGSAVVPFVRPRHSDSDLHAGRTVRADRESRPAPMPLAPERKVQLAGFLLLSVVLHGGLYAAFWQRPQPLASIGVQAISVELVLGASTAAGLANTQGENQVQSVAAAAAEELKSEVQPTREVEPTTQAPQHIQVAEAETAPEVARSEKPIPTTAEEKTRATVEEKAKASAEHEQAKASVEPERAKATTEQKTNAATERQARAATEQRSRAEATIETAAVARPHDTSAKPQPQTPVAMTETPVAEQASAPVPDAQAITLAPKAPETPRPPEAPKTPETPSAEATPPAPAAATDRKAVQAESQPVEAASQARRVDVSEAKPETAETQTVRDVTPAPRRAPERRRIAARTAERTTAVRRPASSAAASAAGGVGRGRSDLDTNYPGLVAAHLARHKRFPDDARRRGEEGTATVSFRLDGGGRVMSVRLVRGSGSGSIDLEARAMVQRASPFPAPPSRQAMSITVPISFRIQ